MSALAAWPRTLRRIRVSMTIASAAWKSDTRAEDIEAALLHLAKQFPDIDASPEELLLALSEHLSSFAPSVLKMAFIQRALGRQHAALLPMLHALGGYE